nr:hypothetical protein [Tanacetum cinerariifolium]
PLGKFDGKADEEVLVGYSINRSGPTWLFDIDTLTLSMNYQPVVVGNQPNSSADSQNTDVDASFDDKENESEVHVSSSSSDKPKKHNEKVKREAKGKSPVELVNAASAPVTAVEPNSSNNTNSFSAAGPSNTAVSPTFELGGKFSFVDPSKYLDDPNMPALEDIIYSDDEEDVGAEADFSNLETSLHVSPILTTRVHKDHHVTQIISDLSSAPQTRSMTRVEPKRVHQALKDPSWIEAIQEELLQFKMQKVWVLVDLPKGFEEPDNPDKVYKVVKALYGLHQAPRAWYETLVNYLLENGFQRGMIDQTLFIKKQKGELTFFLGLQVKQKDDEIFISQDKYVAKILRNFGLTDEKSANTPIDTEKPLLKDPDGKDVDAEYVAAASYCAQVLWIQNQMMDYGHFLNVVSSKLMLFGLMIDAAHLMLLGHKSDVSEGFDQIVDFLNGHMIQYALMVNSTIYVSCIKQFWTFVLIKRSNDVVRLQALIDRQKVIITEDTIRQSLRLDDATGIDCLPNEGIFTEFARMGYEKPSTKLTLNKRTAGNEFSSSMASAVICLATVDDLSSHNTKYTSLAVTQKVLANMRRIGNGFSKVDTPLLNGMLVQQQVQAVKDAAEDEDDDNEVSVEPTPPSPTPATPPPTPTQEHIPSPPQAQTAQPSSPPPQQPSQTTGGIAQLDADKDVTLVDAEEDINADVQGRLAESQAKVYHMDLQHAEKVLSMQDTDEEESAKVEEVIEVVTAAKLIIEVVTTAATTITVAQVPKASAPGRRRGVVIKDPVETAIASVIVHTEVKFKDKGKRILIEEPKPLKRQAQIEQDEAFARQLEAELNANINWDDVMEQELKAHLQIVVNDDDLFTEATPLASKLVQERFQSSEPKNFLDDILLNTLKIMFEKPNVEANIWRDQNVIYGLAKVKSLKLFESCRVHIITLTTTQMILLVEKKYPLTHFTLEQMLNNVRLEVEKESEMSLELLRLMRRQLQEGYISKRRVWIHPPLDQAG